MGTIEGHIHPDFGQVATVFAKQLQRRAGKTGAAVCVYHHGDKVVDMWGGQRDPEGAPWTEDTISLSFSTTKGVAATALHILVDRGLIEYDDLVADHWPEFAQNGKDQIRVRDLMSHEAGLYQLRSLIDDASEMLDWDHMVAKYAAARPMYAPGTENSYHGISFGWLVGELIRRVSGKSVPDFVAAEIAEPLGERDLHIGVSGNDAERLARLGVFNSRVTSERALRPVAKAASSISKRLRLRIDPAVTADALMPRGMQDLMANDALYEAAIPSFTGVFSARAVGRMYAALSLDGSIDGTRLMSEQTRDRARTEQNTRSDLVVGFPMRWRLGYHAAWTNRGRIPGGFAHYGYGGSGGLSDPERQLAVAMTCNSTGGTPMADTRLPWLAGAAVKCADRRDS